MVNLVSRKPLLNKACYFLCAAVLSATGCSSGGGDELLLTPPNSTSSQQSVSSEQSSTPPSSESSSSSSSVSSTSSSSESSDAQSSTSSLVIPDPDPAANGGLAASETKFLGNILPSWWDMPRDFGKYWNQVTPENAGKWGSVEEVRDEMDWYYLDRAYGYAKANGMPFKMHTLVWGSQEPLWVADLPADEQLEELEEWMALLAERYADFDMVEVVNEPQHQQPSFKEALGGNGASGWDWVITSFALARQYFPSAQLHINDYGIINDYNAMTVHMQIVELLKTEGLIDAVGIQGHAFNVNPMSAGEVEAGLDRLSQLALPIYIAELDIDSEYETDQLNKYMELFPVFWEHPYVAGVTLWGYLEGDYHWRDEFDAAIMLADGTEKPALQWLREYFENRAGD